MGYLLLLLLLRITYTEFGDQVKLNCHTYKAILIFVSIDGYWISWMKRCNALDNLTGKRKMLRKRPTEEKKPHKEIRSYIYLYIKLEISYKIKWRKPSRKRAFEASVLTLAFDDRWIDMYMSKAKLANQTTKTKGWKKNNDAANK